MSLSAAIEKRFLSEIEALTVLLSRFIGRWKSASTEAERALIESEAINLFERLIALEVELQEIKPGDYPEQGEMQDFYEDHANLMRMSLSKLKQVAEKYLAYYNNSQAKLLELIGRMKRVRQKQAVLGLWDSEAARFVVSERFLNYDQIDDSFTSLTRCDVDTNQGILTLPVRNKIPLDIKKISVGSMSNGQPGNSNIEVTTNNLDPKNVLNDNANNWFEYERLDNGPITLNLILEFSKDTIINSLEIEPVNLGIPMSFQIDTIAFSDSNRETYYFDDLTGGTLPKGFLTVKSVGNDTAWSSTFLPVVAKTVSITLTSNASNYIDVASSLEAPTSRLRYAVAIRSIKAFRKEFEASGGINSTPIRLPAKYFAAVPFTYMWPNNDQLFDFVYEASFDGGNSWVSSGDISDGLGSTILIESQANSVIWRVSVYRKDSSFGNVSSFIIDETLAPDFDSILRTVSRFQSPAEIVLPSKAIGDSVVAIQPKLARRGSKAKKITLGEGKGTDAYFELPFDPIKNNLVTDLSVYVNGVLYGYQQDLSSIAAGEFAYSDDYSEIFILDVPINALVELVVDKEDMWFEERTDGYYHYPELLFDPDKSNIDIEYLARGQVSAREALARDQRIQSLSGSNIVDNSFQFITESGTVFTEVNTQADAIATADSYYVNYPEGIIYLNSALGDEYVEVAYEYQPTKQVSSSEFEIIYEDNLPIGVKINKDSFAAIEYSDVVENSTFKIVDIKSGLYKKRPDIFDSASNTKTLSYDFIVKGTVRVDDDFLNTSVAPEEVEFINGKREFLGLVEMLNEFTVSIESGSFAYVEFSLSAGALWWSDIAPAFSNTTVFANQVSTATGAQSGSVGDWHISKNGLVTVNVGVGGELLSGIRIKYSYLDPSFDPTNKYSVNYRRGIVYSSSPMNGGSTIFYKAARYLMGYDISKLIEETTYDSQNNTVSVRTESLSKANSQVKLIWTISPEGSELTELKDYFSPIVYLLATRFN